MKTTIASIALFTLPLLGIKAQSTDKVFTEGNSYINAGYGFGNLTQSVFKYSADNAGSVNYSYKGVGPLFFKYEYAAADNFGIGVNVAYAKATAVYQYTDEYTSDGKSLLREQLDWSTYSVLLRLNYHFGNHDVVDPYIGMGAGYRNATWTASTNDPNNDFKSIGIPSPLNFGLDLTFGSRFMFSDYVGAYVEVGVAKAIIQGGLTVKF